MYYNTTRETETGEQVVTAKNQEQVIKKMLISIHGAFSPSTIYKSYPVPNTPITSIRRALNTLKKQGVIKETGNSVQGMYGRPELELERIW